MPTKYDHIDFSPPDGVIAAAKRGLELHEKGFTGSGLEPITVAWARRISRGEKITPAKARQGYRFMKRNKRFANFPKDSPAYAAYMLWFGKPGESWFNKLWEQMEAADNKRSISIMPYSGISDPSLPPNIQKLNEQERQIFVSTFNKTFGSCDGDKKTCETKAFRVANAAVNKFARSVEEIPNLRNGLQEASTPLCTNCWFFTNQWCFKYNTQVSWDSLCDSYQLQPNMLSIENNPNTSMIAAKLSNNKTLIDLQNEIKPYYTHQIAMLGVPLKWNDPKDFHITLVMLTENSSLDFDPLEDIDMGEIEIELDQLAVWECADEEYAIVLTIKRNESLKKLQDELYQKLYGYPMSEYSIPMDWNPHITLGYYKEEEWAEDQLESITVPTIKYTSIKIQTITFETWDKIWSSKRLNNRTTEDILKVETLIRAINNREYEGEEYTEFEMIGFPYTGPVKGDRDLHRTRFTPATDLGDMTHAMPVYLDHGLIDDADEETNQFLEYYRYRPLGTEDAPVKAVLGEETPEGRLMKVLVSKRSRYEKMLKELHSMGILRGSAQSLASMYAKDKDGNLLRFHPGEFSFTVTPSNDDNTVIQVRDVIRNYIGDDFMKDAKKAVEVEVEEKDEMMETAKMDKKEVSRVDAIMAEYATETPLEEAVSAAATDAVLSQNEAILEEVRGLRTEIASIAEGLRSIYEDQEKLIRNIAARSPEQLAALMRNMGRTTEATLMASETTRTAPEVRTGRDTLSNPWGNR